MEHPEKDKNKFKMSNVQSHRVIYHINNFNNIILEKCI